MERGFDLPWSFDPERLEVLRVRMRGVFAVGAVTFAAVAAGDWCYSAPAVARGVVPIFVGAIVILVVAARLLQPRIPLPVAIVAGLVGGLTWIATVSWTAGHAGVFPTHAYAALAVGSASVFPWGVPSQIGFVIALAVACGSNLALLRDATPPPAREVVTMAIIALASIELARRQALQRRAELAERSLRDQRARDTERVVQQLEERVAARTAELHRTSAAIGEQAAERERANELLELLMDSVPAYIAYVDASRRLRWVNRRFAEATAQARDGMVGLDVQESTAALAIPPRRSRPCSPAKCAPSTSTSPMPTASASST